MKTLKKVLAVSLVVVMLLALASCGKSDFQKFTDKTTGDKASYKMTMKMNMGSMVVEVPVEVQGNVMHTTMEFLGESNEIYVEQTKDGAWSYSKDEDGKWYKVLLPADDEEIAAMESPVDPENLKEEDFELKDGKYVLKADKLKDYDVASMTIEIKKNATEAVMEVKTAMSEEESILGGTVTYTITFSDFGKVSLTLPDAEVVTESEVED